MPQFTDLPEVRNKYPSETHLGMKFISLSAGFCILDGNVGNENNNNDGFALSAISRVGDNIITQGIMQFDVNHGGRAGEKCLNATLEIWLAEPIDESYVLSLHRLLKAFVRDEATWNEAASGDAWSTPGLASGVDYQATAEVTATIEDLLGSPVLHFDLSTWINDICNDGEDNFGFLLVIDSPANASLNLYGDGQAFFQRPRLIIESAYANQHDVTKDAMTLSNVPLGQYGTDNNVFVQHGVSIRYGYLGFDFSAVPANAEIVDAQLYVYATGALASITNVIIAPLLVSWEELEITYEERETGVAWGASGLLDGTDFDSTEGDVITLTSGGSAYVANDITTFMRKYMPHKDDYYGIHLRSQASSVGAIRFNQRHLAGTGAYIELTYRT